MTTATAPGSTRNLARPGRSNLSTAELYEHAIREGEGLLAARWSARRADRQAHGPLAEGQVHRRRAVVARPRSGGATSTIRSPRSTTTGCGPA